MEELDRITQEKEKALNLKKVSEEFLINKDEEETTMTLDFARAILALEIEIKGIKNDQKLIKKEAKANGVSVQKVNKAIMDLKKLEKLNDMDLVELETIAKALGNDVDIKTQISELMRKED